VKLSASHRFAAAAHAVCDGMGDPDFYAALQLPDVELPEVITRTANGDRVDIQVRFTYTGTLDPIARRIVGHDHVEWVQQLDIDRERLSCALQVVPAVRAIPVSCTGGFVLRDTDTGCVRTLSGDLRIRVPLIGSRAEKSLAPGIMRRLDLEAEALDHFLTT
jgi:Protein of unknown function (DUF2505)